MKRIVIYGGSLTFCIILILMGWLTRGSRSTGHDAYILANFSMAAGFVLLGFTLYILLSHNKK